MSNPQASESSNPWKILSIVMLALIGTALVVGVVVANYRTMSAPQTAQPPAKAAAKVADNRPVPPPAQVAPRRPSTADIEHCNAVADDARHTPMDTVKDAVIGGAVGAGVGAAGGAIARGGRGAGKGAGIGGLVGITAGTLYGLNSANHDSRSASEAYQQCMAERGF